MQGAKKSTHSVIKTDDIAKTVVTKASVCL